MSRKIDKLRIAGTSNDRRVKLSETQRCEIRERYAAGDVSTYKLANEYGVSRRAIDFVLHPDRYERCSEQRKERGKDGRYAASSAERARIVKEHIRYKTEVAMRLSDSRQESTWDENNFGGK